MEASSKIDQTADRNYVELHRYARLYSFPEFVKNASTDQLRAADLPVTVYADVRAPYQFPCHTKTAAYLSWVWFLEKKAELAPKTAKAIEARLEKFASGWGIQGDLEQLKAKHASFSQNDLGALPDSSFALVWASDVGQKDRQYPLRNAMEVKAAAAWFNEYRDEFSFNDRQTIAQKILEKANHYGAGISDFDNMLRKQAGKGFCQPTKAAAFIRARVKTARAADSGIKAQMLKLADKVQTADMLAFNSSALCGLAETIDQFDRIAGIKVSESVPRLEDVLFGDTYEAVVKLAKEMCSTTTGAVYEAEQFEKLSVNEVSSMFGSDFAEAVTTGLKIDGQKMAEVAQTLPRPDAKMLDELMGEAGMAPITKRASAANPRLTHSELQAIMRTRR